LTQCDRRNPGRSNGRRPRLHRQCDPLMRRVGPRGIGALGGTGAPVNAPQDIAKESPQRSSS
jgi:hypothetical protein